MWLAEGFDMNQSVNAGKESTTEDADVKIPFIFVPILSIQDRYIFLDISGTHLLCRNLINIFKMSVTYILNHKLLQDIF